MKTHADILTTGEVSKIIGVTRQTVMKWIKEGKLKSWVLPYSTHHRIARKDLDQFLKDGKK